MLHQRSARARKTSNKHRRPERAAVLSASTLIGDKLKNVNGEGLGKVEDIVIDLESGRVACAVLSFGSGFLHSGKFLAIPWASLAVDRVAHLWPVDRHDRHGPVRLVPHRIHGDLLRRPAYAAAARSGRSGRLTNRIITLDTKQLAAMARNAPS